MCVGCNKSEPGGRGGNDTFRIVAPTLSVDVKQGEIQTARISVERGAGFQQEIKLEIKAPAGLQIDNDSEKIVDVGAVHVTTGSIKVKPGDKGDVQLKITAAKDAPLGEQTIRVLGTPDKGEPTEATFKVTVSAK
jgi:uncharacterized membrane protein